MDLLTRVKRFFRPNRLQEMRIGGSRAGAAAEEIRAVWMHPEFQFSADPQLGRHEIRTFVERIANAHFNLIFSWVRSEYWAALTDEERQKDVPVAAWDALGELIKVCQEQGIAVHLWYSPTFYKSPSSPDFNPRHGGNPAWAARRMDELAPNNKGRNKILPPLMTDVCPSYPEARQWQMDLIQNLLDRYPLLTGVHIEKPGSSYEGPCVCKLCLQLLKDIYGFDETTSVDGAQAEELRCLGTTELMRLLRNALKQRNQKLAFSITRGYSWRDDRRYGTDWERWARLGWLDFYAAEVYESNINTFRHGAQMVINDLGRHCPVFIGIGVEWLGGRNNVETVLEEIKMARQLGVQGIALFHGQALTDELLMALQAGPFNAPARRLP